MDRSVSIKRGNGCIRAWINGSQLSWYFLGEVNIRMRLSQGDDVTAQMSFGCSHPFSTEQAQISLSIKVMETYLTSLGLPCQVIDSDFLVCGNISLEDSSGNFVLTSHCHGLTVSVSTQFFSC